MFAASLIHELQQITKELRKLMSTPLPGITALQAALDANTTAQNEAIALFTTLSGEINTLTAQLGALNSEDPAVAAIATQLSSSAAALSAAVTAATPVPVTPPTPVVEPTPTPASAPVVQASIIS